MIKAPTTKGMFGKVNVAWADLDAFDKDVQVKVDEYRRQLLAERAGERQALVDRWLELNAATNQAAREAVTAFAKAVYDGEAGQGTLVVLGQGRFSAPEGEPYFRLARIADFSADQRYTAELAETGFLSLDCFRGKIGVSGSVDFVSHLRPKMGVLDTNTSGAFERWEARLVEVALGEPTEVELRELYAKVRQWNRQMPPADQLRLFGSVTSFSPGEKFYRCASSHHSGDTTAYLFFLPTGRWAVIAEYSGEDGERTWCAGVVTDPAVEVYVSGRYGTCEIEGLSDKPTPEEQEFLATEAGL